ncbi:UDP-N-acetylmuramate--L-alanine ligase [Candidatus Peregrinibacteria bacterium]|nr:UDP-N-acetylmuramate--L-alanine ligase [Candidatus Peregrinibacteria bacterium]
MKAGKHIHCIGIGGIGLSGLAQILHEQGHVVSGSDMNDSHLLQTMQKKGITIYVGHDTAHIENSPDLVIVSSAIPETNPELSYARKHDIEIMTFSEAIGEYTEDSYTIAVCGTHGKTTVTSMAALVMVAGKKDPTVVVGSQVKQLDNNNYRQGDGDIFLVEACEYKRNFLRYNPNIIILTNLEAEHLDYYKDLEDYKSAFKEFIEKLPKEGYLIANIDDPNVRDVIAGQKAKIITFSTHNADADFTIADNTLYKGKKKQGTLHLSVPGDFNKMNALAAYILGDILAINRETVIKTLNGFTGSWRRFDIMGTYNGITIINDYAHHPTAIKSTLKATRQRYPGKKICCIFQPHQYNRTKQFLSEFASSFKEADIVIIPNIYRVRDTKQDVTSISVDDLIEAVQVQGIQTYHLETYQEIKKYLKNNSDDIDIALIMGAGDIWELGEVLVADGNM